MAFEEIKERHRQKKPPLGIQPKEIWINERKKALEDAIMRYLNEGNAIPIKWIEELNEYNHK